jgi:NAD-dependent deacetylase
MINDKFKIIAEKIIESNHLIAFTGAGISVESGIPPFRGPNGIWNKYDPIVLDINYFKKNPIKAWVAIKEIFYDFLDDAKPNKAHLLVAELEKVKILKSIITQNIDGLHEEAGSNNVINFHGTTKSLTCLKCGKVYSCDEVDLNCPRCEKDNEVLKPNFVFFGEGIPEEAYINSFSEAHETDLILVIGTTGEVMPANLIPYQAKRNGAEIIEINPTPSSFSDGLTDYYIQSSASTALDQICKLLV